MKIKKDSWKRYLQDNSANNYESYKKNRKKVNTTVLVEKKMTWGEFGRKVEEDSTGNQKLMYIVLKTARTRNKSAPLLIKCKNGRMIAEEGRVMDR